MVTTSAEVILALCFVSGKTRGGVVIVGGSLAASRCALSLRRLGYEHPVTMIGAEPHLPYDRPPLSKEMLATDADASSAQLDEPDAYADANIDVLVGVRATALDADAKTLTVEQAPVERAPVELASGEPRATRHDLSDGGALRYDQLVIATGAAARPLPASLFADASIDANAPAASAPRVHTLRTLDDALAIRGHLTPGAKVVVIGAGFIGSEVAGSAKARGCEVTVLEIADAPLVRGLGPEVGTAVGELHRRNEVDLRLGVGATELSPSPRGAQLALTDGSTLDADVVVVGIGVTPNTGWLDGSGVEIANGVVCDAHLRTNAPDVFAIGDVACAPNLWVGPKPHRVEHWTAAVEHAMLVANNIANPDAPQSYSSVPFVWSDQYDARVQVAGTTGSELEVRPLIGDLSASEAASPSASPPSDSFVVAYVEHDQVTGVAALNAVRGFVAFRRLLASDDRSWRAAQETAAKLIG